MKSNIFDSCGHAMHVEGEHFHTKPSCDQMSLKVGYESKNFFWLLLHFRMSKVPSKQKIAQDDPRPTFMCWLVMILFKIIDEIWMLVKIVQIPSLSKMAYCNTYLCMALIKTHIQ